MTFMTLSPFGRQYYQLPDPSWPPVSPVGAFPPPEHVYLPPGTYRLSEAGIEYVGPYTKRYQCPVCVFGTIAPTWPRG